MRRRTLLTGGATILAAASLEFSGPAQASPRMPAVLRPSVRNLFPEGVTWDPIRQGLLVGSFLPAGTAGPATIRLIDPAGGVRTVVADHDVTGFVGVHADPARRRLLAVYGNPVQPGPTGLAMYDLAGGARIRRVDLSAEVPGANWANDFATDADGDVYVTDPTRGAVYRITPAGRVSLLVEDDRLAAPETGIGANGIVWHPDGYLLTVNYTTGLLFRIHLSRATRSAQAARSTRITEVETPIRLVGGDGLTLQGHLLTAVTNTLGTPSGTGADAVHVLAILGGGRFALPLRAFEPWPDALPTTVASTPYGSYVVAGRLDAFLSGGSADDFVLRRVGRAT